VLQLFDFPSVGILFAVDRIFVFDANIKPGFAHFYAYGIKPNFGFNDFTFNRQPFFGGFKFIIPARRKNRNGDANSDKHQ